MFHSPVPAVRVPDRFAVALPAAAYGLPLILRSPTHRLIHAREDHVACLTLAANYRLRIARGEPWWREKHAWALDHARALRTRFPGALSTPRAPPG